MNRKSEWSDNSKDTFFIWDHCSFHKRHCKKSLFRSCILFFRQ